MAKPLNDNEEHRTREREESEPDRGFDEPIGREDDEDVDPDSAESDIDREDTGTA